MTTDEPMHWTTKQFFQSLPLFGIASAIVASWAVSQYQIAEIRLNVDRINLRFETLPPPEWKYRISIVEQTVAENQHALQLMVSDIREMKVILKNMESAQTK